MHAHKKLPCLLKVVGVSCRAEPPTVSWAEAGAGPIIPLLSQQASSSATCRAHRFVHLVKTLTGATRRIVEVKFRIAIL
jgi:hypothetical protein